MNKKSSSSPAFAFVLCAIICFIGIAFGFYFDGEKGYAISAFIVAAVFSLVGIYAFLDAVIFNPVITMSFSVLSDPEEMDLD